MYLPQVTLYMYKNNDENNCTENLGTGRSASHWPWKHNANKGSDHYRRDIYANGLTTTLNDLVRAMCNRTANLKLLWAMTTTNAMQMTSISMKET